MTDTGIFEKMLDMGQDNALLRFTLGTAFFKQKRYAEAIQHFNKALEFSPDYSAAWKQLGKSLYHDGQTEKARDTLQQGLKVAEIQGDVQAKKEMAVFLKRCETALKN